MNTRLKFNLAKSQKHIFLFGIVTCLLTSPFALATNFTKIDSSKSQITFTSKQMGVNVNGKFKKYDATLKLDSEKIESGTGSLTIELASIDTGSKEGNDEVQGKNWFNVKTYPTARFELKSIKNLGDGKVSLTGDLTIKGKVKPLMSNAVMKLMGNAATLDGQFTFKRLDYNIGEGTWGDVDVVANEVQIHYQLYLK